MSVLKYTLQNKVANGNPVTYCEMHKKASYSKKNTHKRNSFDVRHIYYAARAILSYILGVAEFFSGSW